MTTQFLKIGIWQIGLILVVIVIFMILARIMRDKR